MTIKVFSSFQGGEEVRKANPKTLNFATLVAVNDGVPR